jgi:metallo-beta-lactamase family protein
MRISFHGAAQTVTGSQHVIHVNGKSLLLDCGLFQGRRKEAARINRSFKFDCSKIDAVLLSHAHIDHCGNLPHLVKDGYSNPIYATPATKDLADVMLRDSARIHESDARYVNKKRARKGEQPIEPLYRTEDAEQASQYLEAQPFNQSFEPIPGVRATFVEAGHILGSAAIVLDIEENGKQTRIWFSGDIGRLNKPLLRDPVFPENADYLLMECTYGNKLHRDPMESYDELQALAKRTIERGGKLIIPAFAVGRTQELVYCLHMMMDAGDIPRIPVYVDSPLAVNVSDVFKKHRADFDEEAQEFMRTDPHGGALGFGLINYVRSVEESKALNERTDPMVIISASGMAETGRILHHLKNNIENPKNTVLIASWAAPHTLARRLAERAEQVKIFGEVYERRAEVATIGGFSAHAGQAILMDYALRTKDTLKKVFLVHGEHRGADPLIEKLNNAGLENVYFPEVHSSWEVE